MNAATRTEREQAARDAFWGSNVVLSDAVLETMSYECDGLQHASNGATLAEYIAIVSQMDADEFDAIMALA